MKKPNPASRQNNAKREGRAKNPYLVALFTIVIAALIGLVIKNIENNRTKSTYDPHDYSFSVQGRKISGKSTNPFEETRDYLARVESCDRFAVGDIYAIISCYFTIKTLKNITISDSENDTTAVYEDGSFAPICCMHVEDNPSMPLYRIKVPRGSVTRRTYPRGSEIHIVLNIPGADPNRNLDAIHFSLGEKAPTVLFPVRGNLVDRGISNAVINTHGNDPRIQQIVRDAIQARDELRAQAKRNEGFTYPN